MWLHVIDVHGLWCEPTHHLPHGTAQRTAHLSIELLSLIVACCLPEHSLYMSSRSSLNAHSTWPRLSTITLHVGGCTAPLKRCSCVAEP
jgi:hypothetical protein